VIAGRARGRRLTVPPGPDVRPTKDMVREAVFSALGSRDAIVDASVLDLYAGSGALGIEALSRGAARAVFVESDRAAAATVEENLERCGFADRSRVVRGGVEAFLRAPAPSEAPFTLVLADPPYGVPDPDVDAVVQLLVGSQMLALDATLVVERPAGAMLTAPSDLVDAWQRTFGDTLVLFLVREESSSVR
jgi:16S rRNA (guanine966-N2)-methyltransferase